MLYDKDKTSLVINEKQRQRSSGYCDLVYDIESFIIDLSYLNCGNIGTADAGLQEKRGRRQLRDIILSEKEKERIYSTLVNVLSELGIPRHVKGFRLLAECIIEAVKEEVNARPFYLMNIYPLLAQRYATTPNNVEKLCRYACDYADISAFAAEKYPELLPLFRKNSESITLRETVDALVKHAVKSCRLKVRKRQDVINCR